jgi:ubiquinone/menaquinone biosynthesis C-methylase UbiE
VLTQWLHRLVARPAVYDLCQLAAGAGEVRRRLRRRIAPFRNARMVLDVGGGTGALRSLWPRSTRYICLDIDPVKLQGYRAKHPSGLALVADATRIPLADQSVDAIVCSSVTHHLRDQSLNHLVEECARVLKPSARFFLVDALWKPSRLAGRLLWKYDRGSHPRNADHLRSSVTRHFEIEHWEEFAVWHGYFIAECRSKPNRHALTSTH